jgi:hypothetical protein
MNIKLEPHEAFRSAIIKIRPNGRLVYNYDRLVAACQRLYGFSYEEAVEWTDYNIVGLVPNGLEISYARVPASAKIAATTATGLPKRRRKKKKKD